MRNGNVRRFTLLLLGILLLPPCSIGQQSQAQSATAKPRKVLTTEQKVYQEQWREYMAKRHNLQAQAKQVFESEMLREKAGDCPDANSTYEINVCYTSQVTITEQNLKSYEVTIRDLMAPMPQLPGNPTSSMPGPAGPTLTPDHVLEQFDRVEEVWRQYSDTACTAAFHQFEGGTGGPSFQMECQLKLARDHMRELDMVYGSDLHL